MSDKDIKEIAHCVYMIDLVLREIMHSQSITKKDFATQCIIDSFVRILREVHLENLFEPVIPTKELKLEDEAGPIEDFA